MYSIDLNTISESSSLSAWMTDEQWQETFSMMQEVVKPKNQRKITNKDVCTHNSKFYKFTKDNHDEFTWQMYCAFINDILSYIRKGNTDYCFCVYQIAELLQFEHERLRTEWLPQDNCFKVWLAPKEV